MAASPPSISIVVADGGIGIQPTANDGASFAIGVSSLGTPNTLYNIADLTLIRSTLGVGALVESGAFHNQQSKGKPQYFIPVTPSIAGTNGSVTHVGTGPTMAVTGVPLDTYSALIAIAKVGVQGVGTFTYSLDGGDSVSPAIVLPVSGSYAIPNTGLTLSFPAGTLSSVTHVGSGPAISIAGTPTTISAVHIVITTGGVLGTSQFTYAINGGSASSPQATPTGFTFIIPGTGVTATFAAGTYVLADTYDWTVTGGVYAAGDTYAFASTGPGYTTSDLGPALDVVLASTFGARNVRIVGLPASANASAAITALVQTELEAATAKFKFMRAFVETPNEAVASDSQLASTFAAVAAPRVNVCAGTSQTFSAVTTGREFRRSSAWQAAARASLIPISDDLGWTGSPAGSIGGINVASVLPGQDSRGLWRDESKTPGLDAARFTTLRTFPLIPGVFITKGRLMAAPGSDFSLFQYGTIMDVACENTYFAVFPFLNQKIPTDPDTGFILDDVAEGIENEIAAKLFGVLVTPGHASAVTVEIRRNNNILSDGTLYVKIRVQPGAYPSQISVDIGFTNPALTLQAA